MGFYEEISNYYDYIFPISNDTIRLIKEAAGEPPKVLLDVACGTGDYSIAMDKLGYDVTAIDLDNKMIENLKAKTNNMDSKVKFMQANMLYLKDKFIKGTFDTIFCIGNSLVHLEDLNQINEFLKAAKEILKDDGNLIIQVINYDRIISQNVRSLPIIHNEEKNLTFERLYRYEQEENKVYFKTILSVDDKKFENEIPLYPLLYDDAKGMLENVGFNKIECYGDFKRTKFDKNSSYAMIFYVK